MPSIMRFQRGIDIGVSAARRLGFFLGDKPVDDVAVFTLEPEKYAEMLFDGLRRVQLGGQCDEGIVITNPYFCISVACVEPRTDGRPRHGFNRLHQRILGDLSSQGTVGRRMRATGGYTKSNGKYQNKHTLHVLSLFVFRYLVAYG